MKYKHNDYYGYINKIQERAISDPQWFWSNSEDALQARTWLRNNGAQSIIDDIYNNTPEEMRMSIPSTMLSKSQRENRVLDYQRERTNKAAEKVFEGGIALAGAPALISSFAAAPIATAYGLAGGLVGSYGGANLGNIAGDKIITTDTVNNGYGSVIHTNRDSSSDIGGLVGGLIGGTFSGKLGNQWENILLDKKWYNPAERFSPTERQIAREEWSGYLDNIQKLKARWKGLYKRTNSEFGTDFESAPGYSLNGIDRRIRLSERVPNIIKSENYKPINEVGRKATGINKTVDVADKVLQYYDKYGNYRNKRVFIEIDPSKTILDSFHNDNKGVTLGVHEKLYEPYWNKTSKKTYNLRLDEILGHELAHEHPLFNTRKPTISLKSQTSSVNLPQVDMESPYYGNDYSKISPEFKKLLKPSGKLDIHDQELSESFSDAFGLRTAMNVNGIGKGDSYNIFDILRYKYSVPGARNNRFLMQHPGLIRQIRVLNRTSKPFEITQLNPSTFTTFKQGGILKAQNSVKLPFEEWYKTIPKEYNDTTNYNLRRAYELAPLKDLEKWRKNPEKNHLNSVYKNKNGEYEFMKLPGHPTLDKELEWYNSSRANKFKKNYQLDTTNIPWKYIPKAQLGLANLPVHPQVVNTTINNIKNSKFGKITRDVLNGKDMDLSDEEYLAKYGYGKPVGSLGILGAVVAPEWSGLNAPITAEHIPFKATIESAPKIKYAKLESIVKNPKTKQLSNFQKFLRKSVQEQDNIVKYWNGENFNSYEQLKRNPKQYEIFKKWYNKQK